MELMCHRRRIYGRPFCLPPLPGSGVGLLGQHTMGEVVSAPRPDPIEQRRTLVALYDSAVPDVYGYLASRCGSDSVAEDLTSETFLAAVDAVKRGAVPELTVAWLIGVARHKMVDHWRRRERDSRILRTVSGGGSAVEPEVDDWDAKLDALVARDALAALGAHHRSALTLRYLDGLPVREVAGLLGRTIGATEVLLVRAKAAFRARYETELAERGEEER
ncbi:MAG: polymerase sigma-70 factor, subfamily [Acidimicrobiia bacterium]|nr:polymerase sigma-70 factor, subfamily [Acidimicrobiia bacterium]